MFPGWVLTYRIDWHTWEIHNCSAVAARCLCTRWPLLKIALKWRTFVVTWLCPSYATLRKARNSNPDKNIKGKKTAGKRKNEYWNEWMKAGKKRNKRGRVKKKEDWKGRTSSRTHAPTSARAHTHTTHGHKPYTRTWSTWSAILQRQGTFFEIETRIWARRAKTRGKKLGPLGQQPQHTLGTVSCRRKDSKEYATRK